ncbi:2-dehydropantoate 2-reductase [Methyloceanibacter sp. wino2]|uniref:2-dehydropantoate 2-reductase n=1 Tax=Methyloceanibacter sp. wino2 TaxID=2170729 RepID=UPI000D3ED449|nr:2-dehydropantoate 2-reductase [Methyloceanibacter sp. wino2]
MTETNDLPITVAGAGSVGCYVGARLAAAGRSVTLLTRPALAAEISRHGLHCSDLEGHDIDLGPDRLKLSSAPSEALAGAKLILVAVKSHDTDAMAALIAEHAGHDAVAVSLQNGVSNAGILREHLGPERVVDAMVPFNVVQNRPADAPPRFHRASGGVIQVETTTTGLRSVLDVQHMPVAERDDIEAVLWGKLLVNLNNGLNALSGLPIVEQFGDRRWRALVARQLGEGLAVLNAAGIRYAPYEGVPQRVLALALRLPDALFRVAAKRMLSMDKNARSSMWEDLQAGRHTEIDYLQGEIIRLADQVGHPTPLNRRVLALVKEAETAKKGSPGLSPEAVSGAL